MKFMTLCIAVFVGLTALSLVGQVSADDLDDKLIKVIQDLNVLGASVAYFDNNTLSEPILRAYGKVSSDPNSQDVTPDTVFMIASVSKIFAGAAVLKLVSQGKITLDDDICLVLPAEYDLTDACRNPDYPNKKVTWRMLVTHTSSLTGGIPDFNGKEVSYGPTGGYVDGIAAGNPTCPLTDVKGFYRDILIDKNTETTVGSDLNVDWYNLGYDYGGMWELYRPGSEVYYSNFATGYIAALVEYASGKSFAEYCKENIFDPLGMTSTAWHRKDLPQGVVEAMPVQYEENSGFADIDHYCFIDYASGSLRTTAKDISLFLESMLDYGAPTLWSLEIGKRALQCAEPETVSTDCEFGVCWVLLDKTLPEYWLDPVKDNLNWDDAAGHSGAEVGSQTQVVIFPQSGVYAAVFTNTDGNDDEAAQKLMLEVLREAPKSITTDSNPTAAPQQEVTRAPTTEPPMATEAPTQAPQTSTPTTEAPMATKAPTEAPKTSTPTTEAPMATKAPTEAPKTSTPITKAPAEASSEAPVSPTAIEVSQSPSISPKSLDSPTVSIPSSASRYTGLLFLALVPFTLFL